MRQEIHSIRFTCDSWYFRGEQQVDCPNSMTLTGTDSEIRKLFAGSKWGYSKGAYLCPRDHGPETRGKTRTIISQPVSAEVE
jgi:hypothetical protein